MGWDFNETRESEADIAITTKFARSQSQSIVHHAASKPGEVNMNY